MVNLNKNDDKVSSSKELTVELADAIVQSFLQYGTVKRVFTANDTDYDYKNVLKVDKEIERVITEINSRVSGSFILEPMVPATYEFNEETMENVEITKMIPAVYYKVSTETKLLSDIESIITVKPILDYIKNGLSWTQFKDSFKEDLI